MKNVMRVVKLSPYDVLGVEKSRFATSGIRRVSKYRVAFEKAGEVFLPEKVSILKAIEGIVFNDKQIKYFKEGEEVFLDTYLIREKDSSTLLYHSTTPDKIISIEKLEGSFAAYTLGNGEYLAIPSDKNVVFRSTYVFLEDLDNS